MRVKRGIVRHRRHKKIRKLAKGYKGMRSSTFKKANEAVTKAGMHAYQDRKKKKRDFRSLWIVRLNAALREHGMKYSEFVSAAKKASLTLNRKVLSELAIHEPAAFGTIVKGLGK